MEISVPLTDTTQRGVNGVNGIFFFLEGEVAHSN